MDSISLIGDDRFMDMNEYSERHKQIHDILYSGFTDLSYLEVLDDIQKNDRYFSSDMRCVLSHICELLKYDLCLAISKTCFDKRADNTLDTQRRAAEGLGEQFAKADYLSRWRKTENRVKSAEDLIKTMRDKYLAHTDFTRKKTIIHIRLLKFIMTDAREYYNALCIDKAMEFSDKELIGIRLDAACKFSKLLKHGAFVKENPEEEGKQDG